MKKKGAVALKRVTASFLCLKHKNRTSKSAVFAVKYIYDLSVKSLIFQA